MKLNILVETSLETPTIVLTGRGVEKTLRITEPVIKFLPVVPYTHVQDAIFTIENPSDYPVEFFWHHLDSSFQMDDRVINTLLNYYRAEEILLPPKQAGEPLPANLIKFYNDLLDEMARVQSIRGLVEEEHTEREHRLDEDAGYTGSLHDTSDFRDRMGDPVKELFESIERKSGPPNDLPDPATPEKKVCIIFHGAPFTEYQEAACRSARALRVPVLSIDKAITEAVALGESEYSITLRQIIDNAYQNYAEAHKYVQQFRVILLRLRQEPDPSTELNKIPDADRLEALDPLSRYEYRIRAILQLERVLGKGYSTVSNSPKDKDTPKTVNRSGRRNSEPGFLGISSEIAIGALAERLSAEDFKRGFVLQSLENNLLCNNAVETLLAVLRIAGHAEYFLFVTFLNSITNYNCKVDQLREEYERAADPGKRIRDIDEMSLSEYELLTDGDKKMYLEAILPVKRERASLRRAQFAERMTERGKKKV
ncbi:hydrocephalus-inducing protein homolog [Nomia melanderi]|uniref:hydrocephalus-inducing protein homolog n=1 Tax=Nomia melanderi TaxID=2448451 RepID=UPI003FCE9547